MKPKYTEEFLSVDMLDLIVSQALDIYQDMEPEEALERAKDDWTPTIGSLLVCKLQCLQAKRPTFSCRQTRPDG